MYKLIVMLTAVAVPALAASPALAAGQQTGHDGALRAGNRAIGVAQASSAVGERHGPAWSVTAAVLTDQAAIAAADTAAATITAPPTCVAVTAPDRETARAPPSSPS